MEHSGCSADRFIEALDETTAEARRYQLGAKSKSGTPAPVEVPDLIGGPSRTRTLDPLIKSQLLYQLS